MARTANLYVRIEPEVKQQAEIVLEQLGIPMSNAISIFLRQVALQRGMPFDMRLPDNKPLSLQALSETEFNAEIEKGIADISAGTMRGADEVFADMKRDYGI